MPCKDHVLLRSVSRRTGACEGSVQLHCLSQDLLMSHRTECVFGSLPACTGMIVESSLAFLARQHTANPGTCTLQTAIRQVELCAVQSHD